MICLDLALFVHVVKLCISKKTGEKQKSVLFVNLSAEGRAVSLGMKEIIQL